MKRPSITRLDLITATLLVCMGIALWHISAVVVGYLFAGGAPENAEFTGSESLRTKELRLATTQAEIDATRVKVVEQRLAAGNPKWMFDSRIASLEQDIAADEKKLAGLKKAAPGNSAVPRLESDLKTAKAELDATRAKLVEQRLSANMPQANWAARLSQLEAEFYPRHRELLAARREANRNFERAAFEFKAITQAFVILAATLSAGLLLQLLPVIAAKRFDLTPHWPQVKKCACCVLANYYAFMAAGTAVSAGTAALTLLWLLKR